MRRVTIVFTCLTAMLLIVSVASGQRSAGTTSSLSQEFTKQLPRIAANGDTLFQNFFNCNLVLYPSPNGGYVAGNNGYGDLGKAQKYEGTGGGRVGEILIWVAAKNVGAGGNVIGKIYEVDGSGAPGNSLGTSTPVAMADIDTSGSLTSFPFPAPVEVGDNFFIGVELSTGSDDEIGIITSQDTDPPDDLTGNLNLGSGGCFSGENTSSNAWELQSDGTTWFPFDDEESWALEVDMAIFPVFLQVTGVDEEEVLPGKFSLEHNYPNPFNPSTKIAFSVPTTVEVKLEVYNIRGQVVATLIANQVYEAGEHSITFDASNLVNGIYFYRIEAGEFVDVKKMILLK